MSLGYTSVWDMQPFFEMMKPNGSHMEFGVYTGTSIDATLNIIENAMNGQYTFNGVFGFDSFVGLPKEDPNVWNNPDWPVGAFNSLEHWKVDNVNDAMNALMAKWSKYSHKVYLIPGWYSDTLTWTVAEQLKNHKASYVHIDTDIYISCKEALNWLFTSHLVDDGCIFRFDDFLSTPVWTAGESLALKEITEKFNLQWAELSANVFQYIGTK